MSFRLPFAKLSLFTFLSVLCRTWTASSEWQRAAAELKMASNVKVWVFADMTQMVSVARRSSFMTLRWAEYEVAEGLAGEGGELLQRERASEE